MTSLPTAEEIKTLNEGARYWHYNIGVPVIPASTREKKPLVEWEKYQHKPPTDQEFQYWIDSNSFRNGLAIITGPVRHRSDREGLYFIAIDGDKQRGIDELLTRKINGEFKTIALEQVAEKWIVEQHKDNPNKAHFSFYSPIPFPDKASDSILGIEVKSTSKRLLFVSPSTHKDGCPYEIIGTRDPQVLTELQARELIQHIDLICMKHGVQYLQGGKSGSGKITPKIATMLQKLEIDNSIKIEEGDRHNTLVPIASSILRRHSDNIAEEKLRTFFEDINEKLCQPEPLPDSEIDSTWNSAVNFINRLKEQEREQKEAAQSHQQDTDYTIEEDDDLKGIDVSIMEKLTPHIYSVVSLNPPVMYIAHKGKRKIIKAVIRFVKGTSQSTTASGQSQTNENVKQLLLPKQKLIYAIPIKVIINNNPLDENKTYHVTFIDKSGKVFTIGPASINYIIEELANKGKVLRKAEAIDALTAILNRYEELGLAQVNELVTQAGYFYLKGKFETYKITQNIDREPDLNEMLECTKFLDELSTKWHNKDIFPTMIKWFTLAPFSYIIKSVDKWLRNIHGYGWASAGKTSNGKIGLAIWRLHTNALRKEYQLRFSNIDTPARFGVIISRSTYPKVINEVGALQDKHYLSLLEYIKGAIEAPYVRGKLLEGKYQDIPALCSMLFTGNQRPPEDSGYRSRNILMHFSKDDVHERGKKEAVEFQNWLDSKLHLLGVLGDFIARYVMIKPVKPEDSILFSDMSYENMAKEILAEFYKAADRDDKPEWLDRTYEQRSIVEENTEQAYFELRAFLMDQITKSYSLHIRTLYKEHDPTIAIDFYTRLNFCLTNKLIPYLHEHERKDGVKEILISHDILAELSRSTGHIEGVTTMQDLAKEIPGFEYTQRKFGGINKRVLAGSRKLLVKFLEGEIGEIGTIGEGEGERGQ